MKFKYVGPHDEVEVPDLGVTVEHGHQIEASGLVAESLSKQDVWQRVDKPKPRKSEQPEEPAADQPKTSTEE